MRGPSRNEIEGIDSNEIEKFTEEVERFTPQEQCYLPLKKPILPVDIHQPRRTVKQ